MARYFIMQVKCTGKDIEAPDAFVLELNPQLVSTLRKFVTITNGVVAAEKRVRQVSFEFTQGYWMNTDGGYKEVFEKTDVFVMTGDPMAIVGEDLHKEFVTVHETGSFSFTGFFRGQFVCTPIVDLDVIRGAL